MNVPSESFHCAVVGGGPAGLTAALYLARFHLKTVVFDSAESRAAMIPLSRNVPGFPQGISGAEFLRRLRIEVQQFGASAISAKVDALVRSPQGFILRFGSRSIEARKVLLATGVTNRRIPMTDELHDDALRRGLLRYCPVCDGYEVTGRSIAVVGTGGHALRECEFLRSYSRSITLVPLPGDPVPGTELRRRADAWNIAIAPSPLRACAIAGTRLRLALEEGEIECDTAYAALGSDPRSALAEMAGLPMGPDRCIVTDSHQRTALPGLFAAGDVVKGLDQIAVATGHAAIAATEIRNEICAETPLRR